MNRFQGAAPTRGDAVPLSVALALLLAILALAACVEPRPTPRHLVLVVLDTLRADRVGAYGHDRPTTPWLDEVARKGVLAETAVAHSSWTLPATVSLLTSVYPAIHGAGVTGEVRHLDRQKARQLRREVPTLADRLREAGFATGLFSANPFLGGGLARRFGTSEVRRQDAEELIDSALAWIDEHSGERLFLHLQLMDLHQPVVPPEPFYSMFPAADGAPRDPRAEGWSYGSWWRYHDPEFMAYREHKLALYDGALAYLDGQLARLSANLAERGLLDETLLIVTSDHGEEFWDHAEAERLLGGDPRGIWGIGHGHSFFQELLRVPLIVSGPGIAGGRRIECPLRHLDVAPTALELLALPLPEDLAGLSRARLLRGGEDDCDPVPLIAESPAYGPDGASVTWRDLKLIRRVDGVRLLYDLRRDPGERHDLAGERPGAVAALAAMLDTELAGGLTTPSGEPLEYDEETERQLRALGYLE